MSPQIETEVVANHLDRLFPDNVSTSRIARFADVPISWLTSTRRRETTVVDVRKGSKILRLTDADAALFECVDDEVMSRILQGDAGSVPYGSKRVYARHLHDTHRWSRSKISSRLKMSGSSVAAALADGW